jgi:hypothetical protein
MLVVSELIPVPISVEPVPLPDVPVPEFASVSVSAPPPSVLVPLLPLSHDESSGKANNENRKVPFTK